MNKNNIPEEVFKIVQSVLSRFVNKSKYKTFFFGSRVNGKAGERADIDVAIYGDTSLDVATFLQIKEDFANSKTLYSIDFVDLQNTSSSFRDHVLSGATLPVFA